jgi:hypothetical protein
MNHDNHVIAIASAIHLIICFAFVTPASSFVKNIIKNANINKTNEMNATNHKTIFIIHLI